MVVKIELEVKIWREEVRHATYVEEIFWEIFDSALFLPFDLLATVFVLRIFKLVLLSCFSGELINLDIDSLVDPGREVVDDFHHFLRVFAQVEPLLEIGADVPVKLLQLIVCIIWLVNHVEEEVEAHCAFIYI